MSKDNQKDDDGRPLEAHKIHVNVMTKQAAERPVATHHTESGIETPPVEIAPEPAAAPAVVSVSPVVDNPTPSPTPPVHVGAGIIVLQWLTYAFWGWTILALIWLVFIVLSGFITSQDTSSMVPYAIAATLVLLPISAVCDIFYTRREQQKKTGASMVVMIIHAVIFALFGIGALISAVLAAIQLFIGASGSGGNDFTLIWLYTFLISAAVYAVTFLRTLNPFKSRGLAHVFPYLMMVVVGVFIVLGVVGPLAQARLVKDDRRIESQLSTVNRAVRDHIRNNDALPASLGDVTIKDPEAKQLVQDNLVTYKAGSVESKKPSKLKSEAADETSKEYRYELCVTYKKESSSYRSSYDYYDDNDGEASTVLSTYNHPAGEVCYKQKTTTAVDLYE
jgi:hypothetical protein